MEVVAGIDVGKVSLDVSVSEGPVLRFDNTAKSITRLLKYLKKQCTTMTVCESTGGYERLLVSRLRKTEIAVRVAHSGDSLAAANTAASSGELSLFQGTRVMAAGHSCFPCSSRARHR